MTQNWRAAVVWVDAFITDTFDPRTIACGATGLTHDWTISRVLARHLAKPLVLAGGLNPMNVYGAIREVGPAAVDSHTGVEGPGGEKSFELVTRFFGRSEASVQRDMRKAVLILLVGFAVSAHTEELPVLLFLGQSIAINSGTDAGRLPVKWLTTRTNLLFFNGRTHAVSTAETHWVWYKPPTGPGYATDSVYPNPSGTFGPEISAAKLIGERYYSNSTVAVFKYAVGATDLVHQWRASRPAGDIYIDMRARLAEALTSLRRETGCTGRIAGVFWTQGESDALNGTNSAAGYAENLKDFIVTLRHDLHAGNVPFIYARISPQWPNAELVRSSQERVSKELSAVAMVNADDLATPTRHYDNEGTLRLGGRFAAAFEQVVTVQLSESAEPPTPR